MQTDIRYQCHRTDYVADIRVFNTLPIFKVNGGLLKLVVVLIVTRKLRMQKAKSVAKKGKLRPNDLRRDQKKYFGQS